MISSRDGPERSEGTGEMETTNELCPFLVCGVGKEEYVVWENLLPS